MRSRFSRSNVQIRYSRVIHVAFGDSPGTANVIETMTEVKGNSAKSPVDLPDQLTVECPLFYGEGNQQILVDLKVDTSTECPRVRISSRDADAKRLEAIQAMMAKVQKLLPPEVTVAIGVLDYQPWLYAAPVLGAYPARPPSSVVSAGNGGPAARPLAPCTQPLSFCDWNGFRCRITPL